MRPRCILDRNGRLSFQNHERLITAGRVGYAEINRPPPKPLAEAHMGGASLYLGASRSQVNSNERSGGP